MRTKRDYLLEHKLNLARRNRMITNNFLKRRQQFIIARLTLENQKVEEFGNYRKRIEISLLLSLIIILILFQLLPYQKPQSSDKSHLKMPLEVVEIPLTKQEEPPPSPPVQEMITNYTVIIKNEKNDVHRLRDKLEDVNLELDIKTDKNLLANSQIDNINYASLARNRFHQDGGAALEINSDLNNIRTHDGGSGLDFNPGTGNVRKKYVDDAVELDGPALATEAETKPIEVNKNETELISINQNQILLKESESTIGTSEYRLWNKINAALDRLDKNRFGKLPQNVQRTNKGLIVTFRYDDGIIHDIFWSKGGKVIIRVTTNRPQQQVTELQKAFDSLIRMTL